ncbi:MAG: aldehyde ferredoxin oxidoreductase N-terminal domain-containing protein [Desulfotignum sp.]|nr:aldehyde ferredoxin oxidoreductase N-terminal domain-containing protein [Desulfotignum sp.]
MSAIGLAGENRVYYASSGTGPVSASRGGIGAVMGDKRVKAIAVRGTKDINLAKPEEVHGSVQRCSGLYQTQRRQPHQRGDAHSGGPGVSPGDEGA